MFSPCTNLIYYIGARVKDNNTLKEGCICQINTLGTEGIRVLFDDTTKRVYFCFQLMQLTIIS